MKNRPVSRQGGGSRFTSGKEGGKEESDGHGGAPEGKGEPRDTDVQIQGQFKWGFFQRSQWRLKNGVGKRGGGSGSDN